MLGQYFTENELLLDQLFRLKRNNGLVLEPSSGRGHIVKFLEGRGISNIVSIEVDFSLQVVSNLKPIIMDFFDYSVNNKFKSIVGNPPFVKYKYFTQDLIFKLDLTSKLKSCNLFYYFIEKCFWHLDEGGEIILIIPREFFNSTRAGGLRRLLYENGTITDVIDYEEKTFFKNAAPSIVIIRYEKDNHSHITNYVIGNVAHTRSEQIYNDAFIFVRDVATKKIRLGDVFDVKVGLVSGLNEVFEHNSVFSIPIICSDYCKTFKKRRFIFVDNVGIDAVRFKDPDLYVYLMENKEKLLNRNIKKFDETNWFMYGAVRNLSDMERRGKCIYVNTKTRNARPFYIDNVSYFDGSVLALFYKDQTTFMGCDKFNLSIEGWCDILNNSVDQFKEQGMYVNNKFCFTVKTLSDFLIDIQRFDCAKTNSN